MHTIYGPTTPSTSKADPAEDTSAQTPSSTASPTTASSGPAPVAFEFPEGAVRFGHKVIVYPKEYNPYADEDLESPIEDDTDSEALLGEPEEHKDAPIIPQQSEGISSKRGNSFDWGEEPMSEAPQLEQVESEGSNPGAWHSFQQKEEEAEGKRKASEKKNRGNPCAIDGNNVRQVVGVIQENIVLNRDGVAVDSSSEGGKRKEGSRDDAESA